MQNTHPTLRDYLRCARVAHNFYREDTKDVLILKESKHFGHNNCINAPSFPQICTIKPHNTICTHFMIFEMALGPGPSQSQTNTSAEMSGTRGQIQTTTQHLSHTALRTHYTLLSDQVPPEEPPSTPLPNALKSR